MYVHIMPPPLHHCRNHDLFYTHGKVFFKITLQDSFALSLFVQLQPKDRVRLTCDPAPQRQSHISLALGGHSTSFDLELPAMITIETKLPAECLHLIFGYLSNCRKDIAACRLVSKQFKACSSEFFITRVVFAKRSSTIKLLGEVAAHPYFSKHVTELVYDASLYKSLSRPNLEGYLSACHQAIPRFLVEEHFDEEEETDSNLYSRVLDLTRQTVLRRGFDDYLDRWKAQDAIYNAKTCTTLLKENFARLPKLRQVEFTDFRDLAMDGEKFSDLCKRLFGNTLEPCVLEFDITTEKELSSLWRTIAQTPETCISSFVIGG